MTQPKRKKLIEVALPLEAINKASAREKSIRHGHPSTLHLWWARRPLAACRAVIFASLVDDPNDSAAPPAYVEACRALEYGTGDVDTPRQRLFRFIETLVQWDSTTDAQVIETARRLIRLSTAPDGPPPLLDPFAGGGSIPLEAQRLGLEAHASDLNPVAVMINKALIEIPPKFADCPPVNPRDRAKAGGGASWTGASGLAADARYYGEWMREKAWERIGHLYPPYVPPGGGEFEEGETVIAWLWARTVRCPNPACGAQMPLVRSFDLSKKKGRRAWAMPHVDPETRQITYKVKAHQPKGKGPKGTVNRRGARCLACDTPVPLDYIREEGQAGRIKTQLLAIITEEDGKRAYHAPIPEHERLAKQAQSTWRPDGELPWKHRNFQTPNYGMGNLGDLFTERQLITLSTFNALVIKCREQIYADALAADWPDEAPPLRAGGTGARAYAEAVSVYLAFVVDKATDYWSTIATWMPRGTVGHMFARQAIPMTWDYPEANPFAPFHCAWLKLVSWVAKALETLRPNAGGTVIQQDATNLYPGCAIPISTDPPYYDNISYAELSDYFYVWMRSSLKDIYPDLFGTLLTPKTPEMIAAPHRFEGSYERASAYFETSLQQAFRAMRRVIPPDYPLTVYYAFKQEELTVEEGVASTGWETMLRGLIEAGFTIVGTWPVRTERSARSVSLGTNALASSIVLVCRPRPEDAPMNSRRNFVNELRAGLPEALRELQSGNIAPVDLAQASIGPGMAVYSQYSRVLAPNGDPVTVRAALQLINQVLDEYLAEQEGELDAVSRFAVAWFEQYGFEAGDFGTADVLARAKNTSVDILARAGFLESGGGEVRLLQWEELDIGRIEGTASAPQAKLQGLTAWEATHYLVERLSTHGEQGVARLLLRLPPDLVGDARQLAYRLYALCERKSWSEYAFDYNALIVSWGASQEQAYQLRERYRQGELFETVNREA